MKTVIVEDEPQSRDYLRALIDLHAPFLEVCSTATTTGEAIEAINRCKPVLAFLDIQLYESQVFDIFSRLEQKELNVIFTTAYEQFALSAFRVGAIDYLLKPYSEDEFIKAIGRVKKLDIFQPGEEKQPEQTDDSRKLIVSDQKEIFILPYEDIIRIDADGNYSRISTTSGKLITVSKLISELEAALIPGSFFRVHKSHIVNFSHITRYIKGRGGELVMNDGSIVYVAARKKDEFLQMLKSGQ